MPYAPEKHHNGIKTRRHSFFTRPKGPYDKRAWRRLSQWYLSKNPCCKDPDCNQPARQVDHIDGNPYNNSNENLQSLCISHHSMKTVRENGGFGNKRTDNRVKTNGQTKNTNEHC